MMACAVHCDTLGEKALEAVDLKLAALVAHVHPLVQQNMALQIHFYKDVACLRPGHDHHGQITAGQSQTAAQLTGGNAFGRGGGLGADNGPGTQGQDPVKLLCLANSNRIDNPLFMELKLVRKAEKIRQEGKEYLYDPKRKMLLIDLYKSQISEAKSDTALYQLTKGTEFYEMAIRNSFINEERGRIETRPIKEYRPVVSIGEITIYKHKSRREYYVTTFRSGSPDSYTTGEKDRERFRKKYLFLWQCYMRREVVFEEYMSEILFDKYFH